MRLQCCLVLEEHTDDVWAVHFTRDGRLLSVSADGCVRLWDIALGTCIGKVTVNSPGIETKGFAPSADARFVYVGSGSFIKMTRMLDGECVRTLTGHTNDVSSLWLCELTDTLFSGSVDCTVRCWNAGTGQCKAVLSGHEAGVRTVAASVCGQRAVSGSSDYTVRVWDTAGEGKSIHTLVGHTGYVLAVTVTTDMRVVSASYDKSVRVWNMVTGACEVVLCGHSRSVRTVAPSLDSRVLLSGSFDNTIRLWDRATNTCEETLGGHSDNVLTVAVSPCCRFVASGGWDNSVRLWRLVPGKRSNPPSRLLASPPRNALASPAAPIGRSPGDEARLKQQIQTRNQKIHKARRASDKLKAMSSQKERLLQEMQQRLATYVKLFGPLPASAYPVSDRPLPHPNAAPSPKTVNAKVEPKNARPPRAAFGSLTNLATWRL